MIRGLALGQVGPTNARTLMVSEGAYIVSEQMTTLKAIARVLRQHADSYVPLNAPVKMASGDGR